MKAPQQPAAWLTQGIAFHEAIEKWERVDRTATADQAVGWFDDAFDRVLIEQMAQEPDTETWLTGSRKSGTQDIEDRLARGRQQVRDYIDFANSTAHLWRVWEIIPGEKAIEVGFDMTLNGVRVVGYIDQAIEWIDTGQVTVRDLKTGTKLPEPRQLGIYKVALNDLFNVGVQWGDFYMCKNSSVTKPYNLARYTPERVGRWFEHADAMITQGRFIPSPGDHCRVCAVERFCDLKGRESDRFPFEKESPVTQ